MKIRAWVVWVEPDVRMGIEFRSLDSHERTAIERFVDLHGRITETGLL
jgi:hypothetical protein